MCAEGVQRRGWQDPAPRGLLREKAHAWEVPVSQGHPSVSENSQRRHEARQFPSSRRTGLERRGVRINSTYLEKAGELRASLYPGQIPVKGSFSQLCLLIWAAQFLRQAEWWTGKMLN